MAVLQSTNVQGSLCVNGVAVGGGKDFKYCCFTGSTTWTPTQDLVDGDGLVEATLVGGGGGGGSALAFNFAPTCNRGWAGGGGGGETNYSKMVDITATDACTVTVGDGGVAGVAVGTDGTCFTTSGGQGGNTSFANQTAYGGGGGQSINIGYVPGSTYKQQGTQTITGGPLGGICANGCCALKWTEMYQLNTCPHGLNAPNDGQSGDWNKVYEWDGEIACGTVNDYWLYNYNGKYTTNTVSASIPQLANSGSIMWTQNRTASTRAGFGSEGWGTGGKGGFCYSCKNSGMHANTGLRFGEGGYGGHACTINAHSSRTANGSTGTEGLVIIKWAE